MKVNYWHRLNEPEILSYNTYTICTYMMVSYVCTRVASMYSLRTYATKVYIPTFKFVQFLHKFILCVDCAFMK